MCKNSAHTHVIARLNDLLSQLQALEPLSATNLLETDSDHEEWIQRHDQIVDLSNRATYSALITLPPEVDAIYQQVQQQKWRLLNYGKSTQIEQPAQE